MAGSVNDVLSFAASQVGYWRYDDPQPGTVYGRWYAQLTGVSYFGQSGVPYCAMFVSFCLAKKNVKCPHFPSAVAFDERDDLGGRKVNKHDLLPGDVVAFDWDGDNGGDHVGFVERVYSDCIQTIEGNTDNGRVARKTRYLSSVICGVRPYYADSTTDKGGNLAIDGECYTATVSEWQRQLGTSVDGIISGQSRADADAVPAITAIEYGGGGSLLVRAIQRKVGASVDGYMGHDTVTALQWWLRGKGCNPGPIDGVAGKNTIMAVQRSLNGGLWK